ncbi:MAG: endonuclease III [Candidatus Omnitrophica bacterium]|nr:endonuclease III [Candidatus Omnitrophota bacterium]
MAKRLSRELNILTTLKKEYPKTKTALKFKSPIQILVSTILSAQCTDKRVNMVTETLFKKYKNAPDFAGASLKTFEREIKSTGFYRNKAKNIIKSAKIVVRDFKGKVPHSMKDLLILPGVARKTANIVLYNGYGITEGIAVDTHVRRLSQRLGLSESSDPVRIERDLMEIFPRKDWGIVNNLLIRHGRHLCTAHNPKCRECFLKRACPSFGKIIA